MERLNNLSLDIEFLLISVVQGVALASLATGSAPLLADLRWETMLYIIASFILILSFWSQAIIHSLSFIDWPLNLPHNFLYILAAFIEVVIFLHLEDPLRWFGFMSIFFLITCFLYAIDLKMIKERKEKFLTKKQLKLYEHILDEQKYEFKTFLPAAVIFCALSFVAIYKFPTTFITNHFHLALIGIQTAFSIYVLATSIKSYKKRAHLLTEANF